jgi:copper transport protein
MIHGRPDKRTWQRALIVALCFVCGTSAVHAHATLLQTEPAANSRMEHAPSRVLLSFNERVETVFNSIEVLNQKRERVDSGVPQVAGEGDVLAIGVKSLNAGQYVVFWRVVSLDGHQVQGHFGFGVDSMPPSEAEMSRFPHRSERASWNLYTSSVKWVGLAGMVVWLGGISFWLWAFGPVVQMGQRSASERTALILQAEQRIRKILWIGASAFLVSQCLALIDQAMVFADFFSLKNLSPLTIWTVLEMTNYGQWWSVRITASVALIGLSVWGLGSVASLGSKSSASPARSLLLAIIFGLLGSVILISISLTGHARAASRWPVLAVGSDWAHLAATTIWIGGLAFLWVTVSIDESKNEEGAKFLSAVATRFSLIARICVAVLVITGIYAAWLHMPNWRSFVSTDYGRVLSTKLLIIIPLFLIGLLNWRCVLPALARYASEPPVALAQTRRLGALIKAEATLGGAVLLAVAILTGLPPSTAVAMNGPVNMSQRNADANMSVALRLDSGQVGTRRAVVALADSRGRAVTDAKRVTLYLAMLDMNMGLETVQAEPSADGTYQAELALTMPGRWRISVEVSPARGDTFVTEFNFSSGL